MADISKNSEITVCVTGAGGYIGSHVVRQLLEKGYKVKGTVRDSNDEKKNGWIRKLVEGTSGHLELFSADLMVPGSFDKVVEGCEYVCHVATVVKLKAKKDPYKEIVDPAVDGTKNIFSSILKARCAKRVVVTSSIAAVGQECAVTGRPYNEGDWNEKATIQDPYFLAKTLSEKYAWKVYNEQEDDTWRFELVTILPGFVFGPVFEKLHARSSPIFILQMLDGSLILAPNANMNIVDVRDVAYCHVAALEKETAKGRYIVCRPGYYPVIDIAAFLKKDYGNAKLPIGVAPNALMYVLALFHPQLSIGYLRRHMFQPPKEFDSKRAETELGFEYMEAEKSVVDTAKSIVDVGLFELPTKGKK